MNLKEKLENLIKDHRSKLKEVLAEKQEENSDASFYDLYLDEDGIPYSFGNADDVYSDGFNAGTYQGMNDMLDIVEELLKEEK